MKLAEKILTLIEKNKEVGNVAQKLASGSEVDGYKDKKAHAYYNSKSGNISQSSIYKEERKKFNSALKELSKLGYFVKQGLGRISDSPSTRNTKQIKEIGQSKKEKFAVTDNDGSQYNREFLLGVGGMDYSKDEPIADYSKIKDILKEVADVLKNNKVQHEVAGTGFKITLVSDREMVKRATSV